MPSLNGNQFREFSIERQVSARNLEDPFSGARGFQSYSSNIYKPAFAEDYNSPPEENRSRASASEDDEEE